MKKLLMMATALVLTIGAMAQKADDVMKVNTENHNFGKIKQGVPVTTYFEIKNTSDKPLVVENAWGECGCTTPEIPKEPIMPNSSAKLKVQYNAAAVAKFNKAVYVKFAGIDEPKKLYISGEVTEAGSGAAAAAKTTGAKKS